MTLQRTCVALVATALVVGMAVPGYFGWQLSAAQGEAEKKELSRFQGTWLVHKEISRGADFPPKQGKVVFEGTTLKVYQEGKQVQTLSFRIDPTKSPKEIDLIHPEKKPAIPGIYRFDGDQLTIATGFGKEDRKTRPKSFEDKTSLFILILKKGKANSPDRISRAARWPRPLTTLLRFGRCSMRPLPSISLLTTLAAALPVGGQGADGAAKLFRRMEQALTGAKTLRLTADVILDTPEGEMKLTGSVHLGEGDRARFAFQSTLGGKSRKGTLVSDGKQMRWAADGVAGPTQPTPAGLNRLLAAKLARAGVGFGFFLAVGDDTKETGKGIDTLYPASGFRLGAKEQVGGRTAQVIEHRLTWAGKEPVFRATVWVDVQTHLPLKRSLTASKGDQTVRITEVYADMARDGKLDDKLFELPR